MKNEYIFITGASRGLGKVCAIELARLGYSLILHARKKEHLESTFKACSSFKIDIILTECELSDVESVNLMLNKISKYNITKVLNNAGIQIGYFPNYLETNVDTYIPQFKINTIAPYLITCFFVKKMEKTGGNIVNVTSGINHCCELSGYSASKAALDKIILDLAFKYKDTNISISLVDPGWCQTDLGSNHAPNTAESAVTGLILGLFSKMASGKIIDAQTYSKYSLKEAIKIIEDSI